MKKCLLLFFSFAVTIAAIAQTPIPKGAVLLGGNVYAGINTQKVADTAFNREKGVTLNFVYGKAIKENLILGWGISGGHQNYHNLQTTNHQRNHNVGANVFLRKYKQLGSSGFSVFAQSGLNVVHGWGKITNEMTPVVERTRNWAFSVNAYPGLSYAVSRKFQLEAGFANFFTIGYGTNIRKLEGAPVEQKYVTNNFTISSSLDNVSSLYLGFRVLIM